MLLANDPTNTKKMNQKIRTMVDKTAAKPKPRPKPKPKPKPVPYVEPKTKTEEPLTFRDNFDGRLNVSHEQIKKQIRTNLRRILPQVMQHPPNDYKVALLCGGPSINDELKSLKGMVKRGYKVACVNNTYNWALDHGLTPSMYVQHDARESNVRFVSKPIKTCRYMLCTQVHPSLFDALKNNDVHIWHAGGELASKMLDKYYGPSMRTQRWLRVPGGTTIGTRALFLLYTLGVRTIRVYGMDSSYAKGSYSDSSDTEKKRGAVHHAYPQKENDDQNIVTVTVGRRRFKSTTWMVAQLDEMLQIAGNFPPDLKVSFEGDGLLQYVINETSKRGKIPKLKLEK